MKNNFVLFLSAPAAFAVYGGVIGAAMPAADLGEMARPGAAVQGGAGVARSITFENLDEITRNKIETAGLSRPEIEVGLHRYNRLNALVGVELSQYIFAKLARGSQESFGSIVQEIERFGGEFSSASMRSYFIPWVYNLISFYGDPIVTLAEAANRTLAFARECAKQGVNIHDEVSSIFSVVSTWDIRNMDDFVEKCKEMSIISNVSLYQSMVLFEKHPTVSARSCYNVIEAIKKTFFTEYGHSNFWIINNILLIIPDNLWESLTGYLREHPNAFRNMSALDFQNSLYAEIKASLVNNTLNAQSLTQALGELNPNAAQAAAAPMPEAQP